jgi:dihydrofolate synthase/folylpolyglutamate synthase
VPAARPDLHTLDEWLAYQHTIHSAAIELGLERVRTVADRLQIPQIARQIISVAGTNGKGSSVAILASIQRAAGRRVGCYTSPHLLDYRERIELPDGWVSERVLLSAFERIDRARDTVPLTVFEFGTLAALLCFADADLDVAILEVGLGGRLDAVNIIDADAALITTIDLDHQAWLGPDRMTIGREKAGILRSGQIAVYADQPAVNSVLEVAAELACVLQRPDRDYRYWRCADVWYFQSAAQTLRFAWPAALHAPCQIHNLAACVALTLALQADFALQALSAGVAAVQVRARLQRICQTPEIWLDVAHNPQAAASLRDWLQAQPRRRTLALFGALSDKDVRAVIDVLAPSIDHWFLVSLDALSVRGLSAEQLQSQLPVGVSSSVHAEPHSALRSAWVQLEQEHARLLVFGSFVLAEQVLRWPAWVDGALPVSITAERK